MLDYKHRPRSLCKEHRKPQQSTVVCSLTELFSLGS